MNSLHHKSLGFLLATYDGTHKVNMLCHILHVFDSGAFSFLSWFKDLDEATDHQQLYHLSWSLVVLLS